MFVLGLIFLVGGISKLLPGGIQHCSFLCFLGVVLFALSFIRLPLLPSPEEPMSWFEKVTGIFYEPSRVFRNLRVHPTWLGAFLTIWVLTTIYSTAFVQRITPERIVDHTVEKVAQMGPPFAPPPEAIDKMRVKPKLETYKNPVQRVGTALKSLVGLFVFTGLIPAGLIVLLVLVFGGRINFWQALAVTFYSALPVSRFETAGLAILYLKSPDDLHPILNRRRRCRTIWSPVYTRRSSSAVCDGEFHRSHGCSTDSGCARRD